MLRLGCLKIWIWNRRTSIRHPEVRVSGASAPRRMNRPSILRGSLREHLRMTDRSSPRLQQWNCEVESRLENIVILARHVAVVTHVGDHVAIHIVAGWLGEIRRR